LWQRLARLGKNWVMVDEPLAFYRISPNSLSRDSTQMLADAGIVIARGFSPDSRVKDPAAAHANGAIEANGCSASEALAWFALWNTASDCGRSSLPIDPQSLRALPVARKWAREIARVAVDGLMVGSLSVPAQLAARWDRFGGAITELIIGLGKVWDNAAAARRVQYHLEQMLLEADDLAAPRSLARTLGLRVDARNPTSTELPEGTDQIYAHLIMDGQIDAVVQFGVLGTVTTDHWIELILDILPPDRLSDSAEALSTAERRSDPDSHFGKLAQLAAEALELVRSSAEPAEPPATPRRARTTDRSDRTAFWNSYFATEDPWSYGSRYEQEKYERQLEILPAGPIGRALELACAEGHFTRQLAPRVGRLTATDISAIAIERAGARCSDQPNVEFGVLDFAADTLPGGMDLIFCSE
ncbi:MAG: methyltransferase domain-containing protein, partial [Mesorhizobium sp.]